MGKSKNLVIKKMVILILLIFVFNINFCFAAGENLKDAFGKPFWWAAENAGYNITASENNAEAMISLAINTVLSFIGVIFLVLAIYGGYTWMTARGNEELVTKAKNTLTNAIIGLILVLAAYGISWYVVKVLGDATLK